MIELRDSVVSATVRSARFGQFVQFCIVGGFGAAINLSVLYILTSNGVYYLVSGAIAIETAFIVNFFGNRAWTFSEAELEGVRGTARALFRDHAVRSVGMGVNLVVLFVLTDMFGVFYILSQVVGASVAATWNFAGNLLWTWDL